MERLREQGKDFYKRGDYETALKLFDRAAGRDQSVCLLDNRAACQEKLGNLLAALQDAKKTIQLQREDPTGYLRSGRILVKMGKPSVALEIYTHGLKTIKHAGQGYERLRKVYKELMDELSPAKSVDPFTVLPRELIEYILEYLSFKQRMNACLVSKQWTGFIRSTPHLWQHLDLTGARRKVKSAFVSRAINTARKRLTVATLTNIYDIDKVLKALVTHCQLMELHLLDTGLQDGTLATILSRAKSLKALRVSDGTILTWSSLSAILTACAGTLETLECGLKYQSQPLFAQTLPSNRITTLALTGLEPEMHIVINIQTQLPLLRTLKLSFNNKAFNGAQHMMLVPDVDRTGGSNLEHLQITNIYCGPPLLSLSSSLRTLVLTSGASGLLSVHDAKELGGRTSPLFHKVPLLEELTLALPGMDLDEVIVLLDGKKSPPSRLLSEEPCDPPSFLRRLSLRDMALCPRRVEAILSLPRLQQLQHLDLCIQDVNDDDVTVLLHRCQALHTLDLSYTAITGIAIRQIVRQGKVKHLVLYDCRNLSLDAVDWARTQGVRVDYRNSDSSAGGRRVRH